LRRCVEVGNADNIFESTFAAHTGGGGSLASSAVPMPRSAPPPPVSASVGRGDAARLKQILAVEAHNTRVSRRHEEQAAAEGVPPPVLHLQPPGGAARAQQGSRTPRTPPEYRSTTPLMHL
jgi:hypothetical protein